MAVMGVLVELHQVPDLKVGLMDLESLLLEMRSTRSLSKYLS